MSRALRNLREFGELLTRAKAFLKFAKRRVIPGVIKQERCITIQHSLNLGEFFFLPFPNP